MSQPLVALASISPRRRALLEEAGVPVAALEPPLGDAVEDELTRDFLARGLGPDAIARRLALAKALATRPRAPRGARALVAGDTVVALGRDLLGKPRDAGDARAILERLRGKTHDVWSGVAVVDLESGRVVSGVERTRVTCGGLDETTLDAFLASGKWAGKAGAYGVQDEEARPVIEKVEGSRSNVIGLPLERLFALVERAGLAPVFRGAKAGATALALALLLTACPPKTEDPPAPSPAAPPVVVAPPPPEPVRTEDVPGPEDGKPQTGAREVTLTIAGRKITAEVADTDARRQLGLMNRDDLPDDRGMIFVYPRPRTLRFWMRNTRLPLTIAFLRDDGTIASLEDMAALDDESRHESTEAVRFALEMNKGWFRIHKIEVGAKVEGLVDVKARD